MQRYATRLGRWRRVGGPFGALRQQPCVDPAASSDSLGIKTITITFAVRALSWDRLGSDKLQVDLVDPLTNDSILLTPVTWNNAELASGDWIPMQVTIQKWPGINTPVELVFQVQTDWASPTDFLVDNIRLTTTCVEH